MATLIMISPCSTTAPAFARFVSSRSTRSSLAQPSGGGRTERHLTLKSRIRQVFGGNSPRTRRSSRHGQRGKNGGKRFDRQRRHLAARPDLGAPFVLAAWQTDQAASGRLLRAGNEPWGDRRALVRLDDRRYQRRRAAGRRAELRRARQRANYLARRGRRTGRGNRREIDLEKV